MVVSNTNPLQLTLIEIESNHLMLVKEPRSLDVFANESYSPFLNSFLSGFVISNSSSNGSSAGRPLPENLSAGKNSYTYDAHTYHTKVPPEAIKRLIEHYTNPNELVLDPFCGSGMTGVAALQLGRNPILIDLSPAATFIANNFLTPINAKDYTGAFREILSNLTEEELELYGTHCRTCGKLVPVEYTVWSYGLVCQNCQSEFVLWDVARDERENIRESKIRTEFNCPKCGKYLHKRNQKRTKLYPVQIGYRCCDSGKKETTVVPDEYDLELIQSLENRPIPSNLWYPTEKLPDGVNTRQAKSHGIDSVDDLYTRRNLHAVALLWDIARRWPDSDISLKMMFTVTSLYQRVTRLSEFRFWGGSGNIANYNVPMIFNEQNVFKVFYRKARTIQFYLESWKERPRTAFCVSTQSATNLSNIPDNSIDYVFTDPPFGGNINYSEMNFIWESWLGVFTQTQNEAIVNQVQKKSVENYQEIMTRALREIFRVLKPSRWLTLVFHNSSAKIWAAIQQAVFDSGFKIQGVQTLDKKHGTFKQFVSENAVGYDLMIHCQKTEGHKSVSELPDPQVSVVDSIYQFVKNNLVAKPDEFVIRYLHVSRKNELDTRKLYSMWLKGQMEAGILVQISHDEFRKITSEVVEAEFSEFWMIEEYQ